MSNEMTHDNDNIDIEFPQAPPDRLYAHNRRQLSAMLDGELSPDQARFMLRRLQHDGELAACWERWQVCGDVLRGRGHALLPADFSKRVADAIAAPTAEPRATRAAAPASGARRQHRLLRWGGGALAASVALVALFMARPLPDAQAPELVEAATAPRSAPAATGVQAPMIARTGDATAPAAPAQPAGGATDAAAMLAAAAPAVVAVAEVPRRAAGRNGSTTRSQAQRAALRRAQDAAPARTAIAAAVRPVPPAAAVPAPTLPAAGGLPAFAGLAAAPAAAGGDALFGGPAAAARPWPRAVLPGLSRSQPFAAGYGLPQADAFAPFQPRLDGRSALPAPQSPASRPDPAGDGAHGD